jgi:hypothetical protein
MANPPADPPAQPDQPDQAAPGGGLEAKVDALAGKVEQLFSMFRRGGGDRGSETEPAAGQEELSVAAEVQRELGKLHAEEESRRRETERDAKVEELSGKVAAIPERPPREYRRATNIMGWAGKDDR